MKTPHHLTPNSLAAQRLASERVERASSARIQQIAEEVAQNERRRAVADATAALFHRRRQAEQILERFGVTTVHQLPELPKTWRVTFEVDQHAIMLVGNPSAYLGHIAAQMIAVLAQNLARCEGPNARSEEAQRLGDYGADVFHQELRHQLRKAIGGPATTDALDIMWRMVKNEFQRRGVAVPA